MPGVSNSAWLNGREGSGVELQVDLGVRFKDPSSTPLRGGKIMKRELSEYTV